MIVSMRRGWRTVVLAMASAIAAGCGGESGGGDPFVASATTPSDDGGDDGGDDGDDDGAAGDPCTESGHRDDLELQFSDRVATDGAADHAVAVGDLAVVCGDGFAAVWDPSAEDLSSALSIDGPCRGVAAAGDGRVAIATPSSVVLAEVDADGLSELASAGGSGFSGVAADGDSVWVAAGSLGVLAFSGDDLQDDGAFGSVADAHDVAITDAGLLVAAGDGGAVLLDDGGSEIDQLGTEAPALRVRADGERVAILHGALGVSIGTASGSGLSIDDFFETGGVVLDAAFVGDEVITAEAYALVRYVDGAIGSREHVQVASDPQGPALRAVAVVGDDALAVDDEGVVPLSVRDAADAPEISIDVPGVSVWTNGGGSGEVVAVVKNAGTADLLVRDATIDGAFEASIDTATLEESSECPGQWAIPPDGSFTITVTYDGGDGFDEATLTIDSDDPDRRGLDLVVEANRGAPAVGDDAIAFSLPTLDGGRFSTAEHAGKVVFIKLFNFGCSTCAEEFPVIESELLPDYDPADVAIVGINTTHRTAYAATLAEDAGVTFPMALDLDSAVFRHMRVPGKVFPLHIVIGRDGTYSFISNEPGIEDVRTAIDAAL